MEEFYNIQGLWLICTPYGTSIKLIDNVPILSTSKTQDVPIMEKTTIIYTNEGPNYSKRINHSLVNPNRVKKMESDFSKIQTIVMVNFAMR